MKIIEKKDLDKSNNGIGKVIFRVVLYVAYGIIMYFHFVQNMIAGLLKSENNKPPFSTFIVFFVISLGLFVYLRLIEKARKNPTEFMLFELGYCTSFFFMIFALIILAFIL